MPVRYRYNAKGKKVKIDPRRSAAMKIVTRHLKGKKRPQSVIQKAVRSLRNTLRTGRTVTGRKSMRRKSST